MDIRVEELSPVAMRLRQALDEHDMTASTLALELEVSKASVSDWLRHGRLSFEHLLAVCSLLNISLDWLLLGKGKPALRGALHISAQERAMLQALREIGDGQALVSLNALLMSLLRPQLGDMVVEQLVAQERVSDLGFALCVLDGQGVIVDANPVCYSMLGLEQLPDGDTLIGSNFACWVQPEYLVSAIEYMQRALSHDEIVTFQCRLNSAHSGKKGPLVWATGQSRQQGDTYYLDCMLLPITQ